MEEKIAVALSEKDSESAVKEISLKTKIVFPKATKLFFVFFTPHYKPSTILKTVNFTLKPHLLLGIQASFLIFENRIIEKGVIGVCLNKEEMELKEIFIKGDDSQNIESTLRTLSKNFLGEKEFLLSFLSHRLIPYFFLRGMEISLGKAFKALGGGFIKKYSWANWQIVRNNICEGMLNILGKGIKIDFLKINGFTPLGRPFRITKVISKTGIIMEIENQPAINIYKKYLEEKFDTFIKNRLFSFYPLGIIERNEVKMLDVIDYLDDGSLVCIGNLKENTFAHIMCLQPSVLFDNLRNKLKNLKGNRGLIFIINSLMRKRNLKEHAEEEIKLIKEHFKENFNLVGIYTDYSIFPYTETREIGIEGSNLLLTLWNLEG